VSLFKQDTLLTSVRRAGQGKHTPQRLPAAVETYLADGGYEVRRPVAGAREVLL